MLLRHEKVEKIIHEYKHAVLKSVKGDKDGNVKSRNKAIAIKTIFVLNLIDKREQRNICQNPERKNHISKVFFIRSHLQINNFDINY